MKRQNTSPHILHIIPTLHFGGAERLVIDLATGFAKQGSQISIITFSDTIPLAALLPKSVSLHVVKKKGTTPLRFIKKLEKKIEEIRPDLVHTHLFGADVWGVIAAKKVGLPVVSTEHSINRHEALWRHLVRKCRFRRPDRYVAVSKMVKSYLKSDLCFRGPLHVIYPGIDLSLYEKIPNVPFKEPLHFLMVGRLVKEKGFDLALDALGDLKDRAWHLTILGNGPELKNLRARTKQRGIGDRVRFEPATRDVIAWYAEADVVLIPSRWEGFGMVAMEALASGRVVLAAPVGGIPYLIKGKKTGYFFETGSKKELVAQLTDLFEHPAEARHVAAAAKKSSAAYDLSHMIEAYKTVYTQLLRSRTV